MKRVFLFGVIAYSLLILFFNDWPGAIGNTGREAVPFMIKCLIDLGFVVFAGIKAFGDQIHFDDDEIGVHADDVSVPDAWFYAAVGANLLLGFAWHGYQFANESGATALYNSIWWFSEAAAMAITYIFYKHAVQVAKRELRKAQREQSVIPNRPSRVA